MSENRKRQEDELNALKAIFGDDIKERRSPVNHERDWLPVEVLINVRPQSSKAHVFLDLFINCGEFYPLKAPQEIKLLNPKGIARTAVESLERSLIQFARKYEGEEIIYQLIAEVTDFLNENNKPPSKSFYDQMVYNQIQQRQREAIEKEKMLEIVRQKEEFQRRLVQEEVQKKQLVLQQEHRSRKESLGSSDPALRFIENTNDFTLKCDIHHHSVSLQFDIYSDEGYEEKTFFRGKCIHHSKYDNSTDFLAFDTNSGHLFTISEWVVKWRNVKKEDIESQLLFKEEARKYQKNFLPIEKLCRNSLLKLKHPNLALPLSLSYSIEFDCVALRILHDFVFGLRLSYLPFLMKGSQLEVYTIKKHGRELLAALDYLHSHSIEHGDLKDSNVFIDNITGRIKIAGFELEKRLSDFRRLTIGLPIQIEQSDTYRFALILMWLACGWRYEFQSLISTECSEVKKWLKSSNTQPLLFSLIEKCLNNSKIRTETLLDHEFFTAAENPDTAKLITCPKLGDPEESFRGEERCVKAFLSSLMSTQSNSRLGEYEILSILGSGGFGEVYKVKHILDQQFYALKKIPLNPSNKLFNRKIFFEVKYLSRLNHENVVRYYGAWIECEEMNETDSSSSKDMTITEKRQENEKMKHFDKFTVPVINENEVAESSDDEDMSEGNIFGTSFLVSLKSRTKSLDDYVVFEGSQDHGACSESTVSEVSSKSCIHQTQPVKITRKVMYIQMELCEKNTLRNAIDSNNLYQDETRKRRLFREIVEGLVHIHEHEIIHRDLKPGNIFLDSRDHVKIGDFGLATTEILIGKNDDMSGLESLSATDSQKHKLTGVVGTPLYIAPELSLHSSGIKTSKIMYTQKVDIYSLGIILFEMCYPPPNTQMERNVILMNLRKPQILFPQNAKDHLSDEEIGLLQWLLRHDPQQRPSSSDLLKSSYVPPLEIEEKEQQNAIRHVVANPQSKSHKYLLNLLFQRDSNIVDDYVYDFSEENAVLNGKKQRPYNNLYIRGHTFQYVRSTIESILHKYSFVSFSTPTFMPNLSSKQYGTGDLFEVMDSNGAILCAPYDLRLPFARYVARNKINYLRRYDIQKVFRQRKMSYHPREFWECAFDIVTSQQQASPIVPEAEIFSLLSDIISEFPSLKSKGFTLRINHINLVKALLSYFDVPEEKHKLAFKIMSEAMSTGVKLSNSGKDNVDGTTSLSSSDYIYTKFQKENLTEGSKLQNLINVLELEKDSVSELQNYIRSYLKKKQTSHLKALEKAKEALSELKQVVDLAQSAPNFAFKIKISPNLILSRSNYRLYSGIIFQLDHELSNRKKQTTVLAIGGRYDDLIEHFKFDLNAFDEGEIHQRKVTAAGASIEIDKIVRFVINDDFISSQGTLSAIDVVIWCSETRIFQSVCREIYYICRSLRALGIKALILTEDAFRTIEDLHYFCFENLVKYCIIVKENLDNSKAIHCKIIACEKERFVEKTSKVMSSDDILDYIKSLFNSSKSENIGNLIANEVGINRSDFNKSLSWQSSSDSFSSNTASVFASTNIHFFPINKDKEKLPLIARKRYIVQINSILSSVFNGMSPLEVIALELPYRMVKAIAGEIDFGEDDYGNPSIYAFEQSVKSICDKHQRYRAYIVQVTDKISSLKFEKKCPVITLMSYTDMKFVVLS